MEIVVVGVGVFGAWTALSLAQAGHQVTLLDRTGPGNDLSSSAGESRIIRSAYGPDEVYTAMARRSLRLWTGFFRREGRLDCFRETGVLWMAPAAEPSVAQARAIFERLGLTHEWLDASALRKLYPEFEIASDTVALFEPEAGALLAERCIQAVVTAALRAGVRYEIADIEPPFLPPSRLEWVEGRSGRRFSANHFVFACGSWLPKLFPLLAGVIRPTRQDLFFFRIPDPMVEFIPAKLPIWIDQTEPKIAYGFPDLGNGLKIGFHRLGPDLDPDQPRSATTDAAVVEAADYLARHLPGSNGATIKATQVCHYENTPNGDLLIDQHPKAGNVWLVGGGSGHGFKHAPALAEYVVEALSGRDRRERRFSLAEKLNAVSGRIL
jgi:sarcosine oxidase